MLTISGQLLVLYGIDSVFPPSPEAQKNLDDVGPTTRTTKPKVPLRRSVCIARLHKVKAPSLLDPPLSRHGSGLLPCGNVVDLRRRTRLRARKRLKQAQLGTEAGHGSVVICQRATRNLRIESARSVAAPRKSLNEARRRTPTRGSENAKYFRYLSNPTKTESRSSSSSPDFYGIELVALDLSPHS